MSSNKMWRLLLIGAIICVSIPADALQYDSCDRATDDSNEACASNPEDVVHNAINKCDKNYCTSNSKHTESVFNNDGFVVLDDFLSDEEVEVLKNEAVKLIDDMPDKSKRSSFCTVDTQQSKDDYFVNSADKISYFFEPAALGPDGELLVDAKVSLNKIGHALHEKNEVFKKITFDERVKEVCFQLGFKEPVIAQSMYIFKNPEIGSQVVPHQDASYLYTEPQKILGFWIALEDATIDNGCLWFAKGSHKGGIHRRYIRNPDKSSDDLLIYNSSEPHYQKNNFTSVPVKKGTCILIHGQVVHYSESNKSKNSRHAYTFHVIEQHNTTYSEENWLQLPEGENFLNVYKN